MDTDGGGGYVGLLREFIVSSSLELDLMDCPRRIQDLVGLSDPLNQFPSSWVKRQLAVVLLHIRSSHRTVTLKGKSDTTLFKSLSRM